MVEDEQKAEMNSKQFDEYCAQQYIQEEEETTNYYSQLYEKFQNQGETMEME